jgi:hypothetical protein
MLGPVDVEQTVAIGREVEPLDREVARLGVVGAQRTEPCGDERQGDQASSRHRSPPEIHG